MSPWGTGLTRTQPNDATAKPKVVCMGREFAVEEGEDFIDAIDRISRENGAQKFSVFFNGEKLESPDDAPDTFNSGDVAEIVKDDYGG